MAFVNYPERIKALFEKYKFFMKMKELLQKEYKDNLEEYKKLQISRTITNMYYCGYSVEHYAIPIENRIFFCIAKAIKWPVNTRSYYKYLIKVKDLEAFNLGFDMDKDKIAVVLETFDPDGRVINKEPTEFDIDDLYTIPQAIIDKYGEKANITGFFDKKGRKR